MSKDVDGRGISDTLLLSFFSLMFLEQIADAYVIYHERSYQYAPFPMIYDSVSINDLHSAL